MIRALRGLVAALFKRQLTAGQIGTNGLPPQ
jgi:hypothetical protein